MNSNQYQQAAARTLLHRLLISGSDAATTCYALGLTSEAGEVAELVKRGVFHQHGIDHDLIKKELGNCLWYIAALCTKLGLNLEDIMQANIDKLLVRYPGGFSSEDSKARADDSR